MLIFILCYLAIGFVTTCVTMKLEHDLDDVDCGWFGVIWPLTWLLALFWIWMELAARVVGRNKGK